MGHNPVLETTEPLTREPRFVFINDDAVNEFAHQHFREHWDIPQWYSLVHPTANDESTIDFFILSSAINFAYTDFSTGLKFSTNYFGEKFSGYYGMVACLKRAIDQGFPLLDGEYLKDIGWQEMQHIFRGNSVMPMLMQRWQIFRELGSNLDKYGGRFHNVVAEANGKLFDDGNGFVERLVHDFPSFDDSYDYNGARIIFNKRAQLAAGGLYGRFQNRGLFHVDDVDLLTIFADSVVPVAMGDQKLLVYEDSLAERIDNGVLIARGSREELEIRASEIHAADRVKNMMNSYAGDNKFNSLHLDSHFWLMYKKSGKSHHLTVTTAY